jgi:hypothetical protein
MRTIHFASLLLRGLSSPGQDVWWFTDQDDIVANEERLRSFVTLMATVSSHYLPHTLRHMRIATTASDAGRRDIEDFVAIPDFAAGALQELLSTSYARRLLNTPQLVIPTAEELGPKTQRVMDWLSDDTQPLQRITLVMDEPVPGKPRITSFRFHASSDDDSMMFVTPG